MARFHFCAFNHDPVGRKTLFDMYDWLRAGLEELGHGVSFAADRFEPAAINIVWEHFNERTAAALVGSGVRFGIIVTEFLDGEGFNCGNPRIGGANRRDPPSIRRWAGFRMAAKAASFFWSMVESNVGYLRDLAPSAFVELGYSDRLLPTELIDPDIDFSFTGLMTPYRRDMLGRLGRHAAVHWIDGLHSIPDRDRILLRTRINLSINKTSDWQMPSPTRIGRVLLARRGIAVESTPQRTRQSALVPVCPPEQDFVDFAVAQLHSEWRGAADRAFERYRREMPMRDIVERLLDRSLL